ncbi:MAG TPA: YeeE/YedE family protein [Anaerolineae bacterium]|nr:YeeE/YedE family protein [Anaerolineae bacterium]
MIEFILSPWPWWFSGTLLGLAVPLFYILAGKALGVSTSFQHIDAMCSPNTDVAYFKNYNWRANGWRLVFIAGLALGGFLATTILSDGTSTPFFPDFYHSTGGAFKVMLGGVFVGFGARYAGGCTSGHTITGLSNLSWPSLVATISFFAGGVAFTWLLGGFFF